MNLIVDTSIWIEFFRGEEAYHTALVPLIEQGRVLAHECVFGELLQGARTERERVVLVRFWRELPKTEIQGLFLLAGRLASVEHFSRRGVGLIDATIVVAARHFKACVWSLDKKLYSVLLESERYAASPST